MWQLPTSPVVISNATPTSEDPSSLYTMDRKILGGTGTCREKSLWEGPTRDVAAAGWGSRPPACPWGTQEPGLRLGTALPLPFPSPQAASFRDRKIPVLQLYRNEKESDSGTESRVEAGGWRAAPWGRVQPCRVRVCQGWFVQPITLPHHTLNRRTMAYALSPQQHPPRAARLSDRRVGGSGQPHKPHPHSPTSQPRARPRAGWPRG